MITIDLVEPIFVLCVAVGGVLLLLTVLLDDILGGVLDFLNLGFDIGGVTLMPLVLAFVSMFGVGGLFGTRMFGLGAGEATLMGIGFGVVGVGIAALFFNFLRRAEAPPAFSLSELVGERGRVSVTIPAHRSGEVILSYGGNTHNLTATADTDIPAGTVVVVVELVGSTVVVKPATAPAAAEGGMPNA